MSDVKFTWNMCKLTNILAGQHQYSNLPIRIHRFLPEIRIVKFFGSGTRSQLNRNQSCLLLPIFGPVSPILSYYQIHVTIIKRESESGADNSVGEPISSPKGGDMRQDKKMARICVKFSLATWATFFF